VLYISFSLLNDQSKTIFNIYSTVRDIARQITVIDISLMGDSNTLKCKCKRNFEDIFNRTKDICDIAKKCSFGIKQQSLTHDHF
jgi:hypothetical protein